MVGIRQEGWCMHRNKTLVVLAGLVSLAGCGFVEGADWSVRGRFEKSIALQATGVFHLENVNGRVSIEPWNREEVQIEAEKAASSQEALDEIKIEIEGEGQRIDVKTRFPRGGLFGGGGGRVDYRIRVPVRASLDLRTVNGEVRVERMDGSVRASTVNGGVKVYELAGPVDASTVNGSIHAGYRKPVEDGRHNFSTTNGSVTIEMPGAAGDFEAHTVNGGISTDFPLQVSGKIGPRRLKGRLGSGRATFQIRTVNGGVKLIKGGSGEKVV